MLYDAAIIGTGPAGLSAALNLKIHQKNFVWFGTKDLSEKIRRAERVSNYPGLPDISGEALARAFREHIEKMDLTITEAMVNAVYPMGDRYALSIGADFCEAKALILATGVAARNTLPGEAERVGRGVSYCATCDGMLYRGKTIAVLSSAERFAHEVKYLAGIAEKVYFFPTYKDAAPVAGNVEVIDARIREVAGEPQALTLTLTDGATLGVNGLFCLRDSIALNTLLPTLALEDGHIAVDRGMATNLPGCFAAGDCTGRPYQYTKAVGEGNVAAHSVLKYLDELEKAAQ